MRYTFYQGLLALIILGTGCKNSSSVSIENMEFPDSISNEQKEISLEAANEMTKTMNETESELPEAVQQKKSEIIAVKIATSIFYDEGCCKEDIANPKACCCDDILKRYTELWKNEEWDNATKARNDEILNRCRELNINNFSRKLKDIEKSEVDIF